jgi:hypothetical protein
MTLGVVIEPFEDDDLVPLHKLFASYFPPDNRLLAPQYSRWLYDQNPFGKSLMVKVLEDERWVGFMAMVPVTLTKEGEDLSAYYVVNVLVHPDFHGKHLFGRMIKAAMVRVEQEQAALLGHPNDMALKSWQRAGMHFQEALRPSLAIPRPWDLTTRAQTVDSFAQLESLRGILNSVLRASPHWRVAASPEYLSWRYLNHPTNLYHFNVVLHNREAIGVQASKRIKPGLSLLIDQFLPDKGMTAATGKLPACTVCFLPGSSTRASVGKILVPLKKRIPFFMTRPTAPVDTVSTTLIGLSPSDF